MKTPEIETIVTRLSKMVRTPNVSFHYRDDCDAVAGAAEALAALAKERDAIKDAAQAAAEGIQRALVEDDDAVGAAALAGVLLTRLAEFG